MILVSIFLFNFSFSFFRQRFVSFHQRSMLGFPFIATPTSEFRSTSHSSAPHSSRPRSSAVRLPPLPSGPETHFQRRWKRRPQTRQRGRRGFDKRELPPKFRGNALMGRPVRRLTPLSAGMGVYDAAVME